LRKHCRFGGKQLLVILGILKKIPVSIALHCSALLRQCQLDQTHMLLAAVLELEEWADLTVKGADLAVDWRLPQGLPRVIRVQ